MDFYLTILELASAVLLIVAILMQNRSTGLGSAFGGSGNIQHVRRGVEQQLFTLTIILSVVFLASSVALFLIG